MADVVNETIDTNGGKETDVQVPKSVDTQRRPSLESTVSKESVKPAPTPVVPTVEPHASDFEDKIVRKDDVADSKEEPKNVEPLPLKKDAEVVTEVPKKVPEEAVSTPMSAKDDVPKEEGDALAKEVDPMNDVTLDESVNSEDIDQHSMADDEIVVARKEMFEKGKDFYCFHCHKERVHVSCSMCPRSYHYKCLPVGSHIKKGMVLDNWECPECIGTLESEEERKHSATLSRLDDEGFSKLLRFALGTIKQTSEPSFHYPVADSAFPDYKEFIINPMDFTSITAKIRRHEYKSTVGFLADFKWIVHNCTIYNDVHHPLTKNVLYTWKVAKNEMAEIEVCPDCFRNFYHFPKSWFIELCDRPHVLAWARLKGHPFWPCKIVRIDTVKGEADCRFFGAHDRAWVPYESVFQLSNDYPWTKSKAHKSKLETALKELTRHVEKIQAKFPQLTDALIYSQPKTPFNPKRAYLTDPIPHGTVASPKETASDFTPSKPSQKPDTSKESSARSQTTVASQSTPAIAKRGPGRPFSTNKPAAPQSDTIKRKPGRPPRSAQVQPESDDGASTESEGALVIDTPASLTPSVASSSRRGRKRGSSSIASSSTTTPSVSSPARGRPGRRPKSETKEPLVPVVPAKRTRNAETASESSTPSSSRKASAEADPPLTIDEEEEVASSPKRRPGRPPVKKDGGSTPSVSKVMESKRVKVEKKEGVVKMDTSELPTETEMDRKLLDEIEQLKKEVSQLQRQLETDRETHAKEMKSIRDVIEKEMALRKSEQQSASNSKSLANNVSTSEVSLATDAAGSSSGKTLSDHFKKVIEDTKKQQWCASCLNKAIYFCCWNTSYCGYECQSKHWPQHMNVCQQHSRTSSSTTTSSSANTGANNGSNNPAGRGAATNAASSASSPSSTNNATGVVQRSSSSSSSGNNNNNNVATIGGVRRVGGGHSSPNVNVSTGVVTGVAGRAESTDLA